MNCLCRGRSALVKTPSAREFFAAWIEKAEQSGKSETTLKHYRQIARDFVDSLGEWAEAPCEQIRTEEAQPYLECLNNKGLALKTIENSHKILKIPFTEYCRLGKLAFNPAAVAKPLAIAQDSPGKTPFIVFHYINLSISG